MAEESAPVASIRPIAGNQFLALSFTSTSPYVHIEVLTEKGTFKFVQTTLRDQVANYI